MLGIRRSSQQSMSAQLLDVQLGEDEAGSVLQCGEQVDLRPLALAAPRRLWLYGQAARDGHAPEQASTWPTAQDQGHVCELGGESVRAACLAAGQGRYLLGERPTGTAVGC